MFLVNTEIQFCVFFLVHQSCGSDTCRPQTSIHDHCRTTPNLRPPLTPPELRRPGSSFDHHIPKIEPDTTPSTPPTPPSRYVYIIKQKFLKI